MKKFFKWLGIVLGGLVGLIVLVFLGLALKGNASFTRTYDIQVENISIPTDAESIARGDKWVHIDCVGCHGEDLSGGTFFEAPFGYIDAKNLTPGKGGVGSEFTDADWVRAIRHGVTPAGRSLMIMPAPVFWHFSDEDLGSIIAYLKTLPPVDKETREPNINLIGKAMNGAGVFGNSVFVAENIQHDTRPTIPPAAVTVEFGEYLVNVSGCRDCHGPQLTGGKSAEPTAKAAPNLTPGGELVAWTEEDFIKAIRTGTTLSGQQLDPAQMPWKDFNNFTDDELKTIFMYLKSLPKLETVVP